MRRLALLTALAAVLLAPAGADAATRWVVRGGGWGHGIGMSQYGAYGYALNGYGYRTILTHYYQGTTVEQSDTRTIRILLQASRLSGAAFSGASSVAGVKTDPRFVYVATRNGPDVKVRRSGGGTVGIFSGVFTVRPGANPIRLLGIAINGVNGGTYRGNLELRPGVSGGVTAVNAASIDDYVQGVVPGEMPSLWPDEALKSQAVAARSYALATDAGGDVFDQYPDTRSQMYYGVSHEQVSTNNATRATAGEVVKYQGVPIPAFFFSTSGGYTENIENVWYGSAPRPYLKGVPDPYETMAPRHRWTFNFTQRQIESRLRGYLKGTFRGLKVLRRGVSPRVVSANVLGSRGTKPITGTALRQRLGLYDNWLALKKVTTTPTKARASSVAGVVGSSAVRSIRASIEPAPRGYRALVERKVGHRWKLVGEVRLSRAGAAYVKLDRAGVYRVRSGAIEGPPVRVR
ncbi:MAG: hypothetical protein QOE08_2116 [Thermoleophilaceae bacterium]|jgi:stage II sporulation protein D|nr:hypothetical protein [Thermoleophilaceae bacterium]